jgi:deoxyribose-phosphate aldolase
MEDLKLLVRKCAPYVQVKAGQGIQNLDQLLEAKELGVTRFGTTRTAVILKELKHRLTPPAPVEEPPSL